MSSTEIVACGGGIHAAEVVRPPRRTKQGKKGDNRKEEVVAKEGMDEQEAEAVPPPEFTGSRIGGATNFLGDSDSLSHRDMTVDEFGHTVPDLVFQASVFGVDDSNAVESTHTLATPKGWRRFWGTVYPGYLENPDILVSPFCRACYEVACYAAGGVPYQQHCVHHDAGYYNTGYYDAGYNDAGHHDDGHQRQLK